VADAPGAPQLTGFEKHIVFENAGFHILDRPAAFASRA